MRKKKDLEIIFINVIVFASEQTQHSSSFLWQSIKDQSKYDKLHGFLLTHLVNLLSHLKW